MLDRLNARLEEIKSDNNKAGEASDHLKHELDHAAEQRREMEGRYQEVGGRGGRQPHGGRRRAAAARPSSSTET